MTMKNLHVVIGIVRDELGRVLIALRPPHVYMPGVWEFPGGKVEAGEDALAALKREYHEEIGIEVTQAHRLLEHHHTYPDRTVFLDVWEIEAYQGKPQGCEGQEICWSPLSKLNDYTFPAGNGPILEFLQQMVNDKSDSL